MKFKALLVTCLAFAISYTSFAQVDVTFRVDMTNFLAGGDTLSPNGLRVGGNFSANGAMNGATAVPDWSPSDANCAMTDIGMGYWEITLNFPSANAGDTLLYKFVNGDWFPNLGNEGFSGAGNIANDGCGLDDGAGSINRILVIPAADDTVGFCWDECVTCDMVSGINDLNNIESANIYPNPVTESATIEFSLLESVSNLNVVIYDAIGNEITTLMNERASAGTINLLWDGNSQDGSLVQSGVYFVVVKSDNSARTQRLLVVR